MTLVEGNRFAGVTVLIPALNPDSRLRDLVSSLVTQGIEHVLIVNDGSRPEHASVFTQVAAQPRCTVLAHPRNLGKGEALKTGMRHIMKLGDRGHPVAGIVTADADGQHLPHDILRIAEVLREHPDSLIMGVRSLGERVPLRSALGNGVTRQLFSAIVGTSIQDTQTGLRGIPMALVPPLLATTGSRYEYEMNVLVASKRHSIPIIEVPIETVYIDGNKSSHFRPLWDSMAIYAVLFRFVVSSLLASAVDLALFASFAATGIGVGGAMILARCLSSIFYLVLKRDVVFRSTQPFAKILVRYYALVAVMALVSTAAVVGLTSLGTVGALAAKVTVESLLFWVSFIIQRDYIFYRTHSGRALRVHTAQLPAGTAT